VHFLVQTILTYGITRLVTVIKSLTAREVFRQCPQVKKQLWGGEFWTHGYFARTVGKHGNEHAIGNYVREQGRSRNTRRCTSIINLRFSKAIELNRARQIPCPLGRGWLLGSTAYSATLAFRSLSCRDTP
jgi:hypothetical protein